MLNRAKFQLSRAFTMVELLSVITIILILSAMLLPTIGYSRRSSQRIHCLSNLHQMIAAGHGFVNDNSGYFPIAYYFANEYDTAYSYGWDLTTTTTGGNASIKVLPGLLWQGTGVNKVQQCPSYAGPANWL